jgi:hypothetical protein
VRLHMYLIHEGRGSRIKFKPNSASVG